MTQISRFQPEHYLPLARLWNYAYPHLKTTSTNIRLQDKIAPLGFHQARWIAEQNAEIVGFAGYENYREENFNPRKFRVHVVVRPESAGRGLGRRLLSQVVEALKPIKPIDASVLVCLERERSVAFAKKNGFEGELEWHYSRLDLEQFALPNLEKLAEQWRGEGVTFHPFHEFSGEAGAGSRLSELYCSVRRDVPSSDSQPLPARDDFDEKLRRFPTEFDGYFVALHQGRFVGLGVLAGKPYIEGELHNEILGVLPEFRRQGVALGVIVRAIEWARSKGFRYVTAENSATNKAVIPLMELVGFQRQARWQLYRKTF